MFVLLKYELENLIDDLLGTGLNLEEQIVRELKTLFTLPINKIEYKDVELFCSQNIPENSRLDYKKELKKILLKQLLLWQIPMEE